MTKGEKNSIFNGYFSSNPREGEKEFLARRRRLF